MALWGKGRGNKTLFPILCWLPVKTVCKEDKFPEASPRDKLSLQLLQSWIFLRLPLLSSACSVKSTAQVALSVPAQTCTSLSGQEGQAAMPLELHHPTICQKDLGLPTSTMSQGSRRTRGPLPSPLLQTQPCLLPALTFLRTVISVVLTLPITLISFF